MNEMWHVITEIKCKLQPQRSVKESKLEYSLYRYDPFKPLKRGLTKELKEIYLEMQKLHIHKKVPSARLVQKLEEIVNAWTVDCNQRT